MPNKNFILLQLKELKDYLQKLEEFKDIGENDFEKKWKIYWNIDHGLHLSIQACIDIAKEIIAIKQLRKPKKYKDIFIVLRQNDIVSHEVGNAMEELAAFRNRLIHEYMDIDPKEIYRVYTKKRKYLHCFAKEVVKWLKNQTND